MQFKIRVNDKQRRYINSTSATCIYAGGIGAGKSIANVLTALHWASLYPGIRILVCAPTYAMLHDTLIHEFRTNVPSVLIKDFRGGAYPEAVVDFGRGESQVLFRAFDDAFKPRSITIGGLIVDEVVALPDLVLSALFDRLRMEKYPNYARLSTNSDSTSHPFYKNHVLPALQNQPGAAEYISTTSFENKHLPENYLERLRNLERNRPLYYRRMVLGEWIDIDEDSIGAFLQIPAFTTEYKVAFIDTSFSDRTGTDRTAVAVVGFTIPRPGQPALIEATGKSYQKSISNPEVINDIVRFLDIHKPIESQMESQLGDSTQTFLDRFRQAEIALGVSVKNNWTVLHQTKNKHERIMLHVAGNKDRIRILSGTQQEFLGPIIGYTKQAKNDDEADALAGAINLWQTSKALKNYIRLHQQALQLMGRQGI